MYTANQIKVGKVPNRHKEHTCILEVSPAEIELEQMKISHFITRVSLDFYKDLAKMIGIRFAIFKCTDHPTYHSRSHVAADRLTGHLISGWRNLKRKLAGVAPSRCTPGISLNKQDSRSPFYLVHHCFWLLVHHELFKTQAVPFLLWAWKDTKVLSLPRYAAVRVWKGGEKFY